MPLVEREVRTSCRAVDFSSRLFINVPYDACNILRRVLSIAEKNGFVTATKLGTTNEFFVASTKHFAAATKRFVGRTKHFVVVTKYFWYPYFNK